MKKHRVYLGLGSNLGNRKENLRKACEFLDGKYVNFISGSSVYETEPFGIFDQPKFLNMVCEMETPLSPHDLLDFCKNIEKKVGRTKRKKWGPREIDIDILFYDNEIVNEAGLEIPHPGIAERISVLKPLNEIAPSFIHPVLKKTVSELLNTLPEKL